MQKTQATITLKNLLKILKPGDIGLTENPEGLGKIIKWFQELEGDEAIFTHAFIVGLITFCCIDEKESMIYESNGTIAMKPLNQYVGKHIYIIRHHKINQSNYHKGIKEIYDNLGMRYPYYRLVLIGIDIFVNRLLRKIKVKPLSKISSLIKFDRPVCSELAAQFLLKCGVKTYFTKGEKWTNINPDDIHDAALKNKDVYKIVFDGILKV